MFGQYQRTPGSDQDPAWQPPEDAIGADIRDVAQRITREIPLSIVQTSWTPSAIRQALIGLVIGLFDQPAQLIDSIVGDSRVQASLQSLSGGLFSRPIIWSTPRAYRKDSRAKECLAAWKETWPSVGTEGVLSEFMTWDAFIGFAIGQLVWDTSMPDLWKPQLLPWHPRYSYFEWLHRKYVAITMDGLEFVEPGSGHWVLHTPHNPYRGWMRGAVRAVAPWWLSRNYALRDFSRYSERHGMPVIKAISPFGADATAIAAFRAAVRNMGQESVMQLPQSGDEQIGKYDLELLEASDQGWDGFKALIDQCNQEIVLPLQGQTLTTEVKEGSLAAARVHGDVRQAVIEAKGRGFQRTINEQIVKPFAAINYGDSEMAPRGKWDLELFEDQQMAVKSLLDFANALNQFRTAGKKVGNIVALAKTYGLHLSSAKISDVAPVQVEARAAGEAGKEVDREQARASVRQRRPRALKTNKTTTRSRGKAVA